MATTPCAFPRGPRCLALHQSAGSDAQWAGGNGCGTVSKASWTLPSSTSRGNTLRPATFRGSAAVALARAREYRTVHPPPAVTAANGPGSRRRAGAPDLTRRPLLGKLRQTIIKSPHASCRLSMPAPRANLPNLRPKTGQQSSVSDRRWPTNQLGLVRRLLPQPCDSERI